MTTFRRFTRRAWLLHGYLLASMILWPVPAARSYWTWDAGTGTKVQAPDPPLTIEGINPDTGASETIPNPWWDQDLDGDGLTNAEEVAFGSDPYSRDSDYDGLTDTDERDVTPAMLGYSGTTDPWNWDSDGDGASDHDEYWSWQSGLSINVSYSGQTPPNQIPTDYYRDIDGDGTYNLWDYSPYDSSVTSPPSDPGMGGDSGGSTPPDPSTIDSDGDGIVDANDSHPTYYYLWEDWNYNGTNDSQEPPPPTDSDWDGYYDTSDSDPYNSMLWEDWNHNGTNDSQETPPTDPGSPSYPPDPYYTDGDGDGTMDANDSDPSNASLWDDWNRNGTNDSSEPPDSDGDGVIDDDENVAGTNPWFHDSDGDGLSDSEERTAQTNPLLVDTDGDGLTDHEEIFIFQTNPLLSRSLPGQQQTDYHRVNLSDTDSDGIPDLVEAWYGRDPASDADAASDLDLDGHTDLEAFLAGWSFTVAFTSYDQDRDGITDARESYWGFNPYDANDATQDADHDGLLNIEEIRLGLDPLSASTHGTPDLDYVNTTWNLGWQACLSPGSPATSLDNDTDGDGMSDAWEHRHRLNLRDPSDAIRDPDRDGLSNLTEFRFQSHPRIPKTQDNIHDRTRLYATGKPLNASTAGGLMNRYRAQMAADLGAGYVSSKALNETLPADNSVHPKLVVKVTTEETSSEGGSTTKTEDFGLPTTIRSTTEETFPCTCTYVNMGGQTDDCTLCIGGVVPAGTGEEPGPCPQCGLTGSASCGNCGAVGSFLCGVCNGSGNGPGGGDCARCLGVGRIECLLCLGTGKVNCLECSGSGNVMKTVPIPAHPCLACNGTGQITTNGTEERIDNPDCKQHNRTDDTEPVVIIRRQSAQVILEYPPGSQAHLDERFMIWVNGRRHAVLSSTFTSVNVSRPAMDQSKHIELGPLDVEESVTVSAHDSAGPRYRKIGLNGVPLQDSKPQSQDESGEPPEETYIDAYTRQLRHSVTDVYATAEGDALPLMIRRDVQPEAWNNRSGLRPQERPDSPFGLAWSSNIASFVRFEMLPVSQVPQQPVTGIVQTNQVDPHRLKATVVDEMGSRQTFLSKNSQWYHTREEAQDAKTIQNTFTSDYSPKSSMASLVILQKKFGTTCIYEMTKLVQVFPKNRQQGGFDSEESRERYTYARLSEVRDRHGNRLKYYYTTLETLVPWKIEDPDRPGRKVTLTQFDGVVTKVRGPDGQTITYNYTELAPGMRVLSSVERGASTVSYAYNAQAEVNPNNDTNLPARYMHVELSEIKDELERSYQFHYDGFDWGMSYQQYKHDDVNQTLEDRVQAGLPRPLRKVTMPNDREIVVTGGRAVRATLFSPYVQVLSSPWTEVQSGAGTYRYDFSDCQPSLGVTSPGNTSVAMKALDEDPNSISVIVNFAKLELTSPAGKETFTFNPSAAMALASVTDVTSGLTEFDYGTEGFDDPLQETSWLVSPGGNRTAVTKQFTYDPATRIMTSMTDPMGVTTSYEISSKVVTLGDQTFTVQGLKTKEFVAKGGVTLRETRFSYDHPVFHGLVTSQFTVSSEPQAIPSSVTTTTLASPTDSAGASQIGWWAEVTHDSGPATAAGALASTLSSTTTIGDLAGRKRSVVDARGLVTNFDYDSHGRLSRVNHPDGAFRAMTYDGHGNLIAESQGVRADGVDTTITTTFHRYDALNRRIKTAVDLNGNGQADWDTSPNADYGPDDHSYTSVTTAADGSPVYNGDLVSTMTYNARNQLLTLTDPRGKVTSHQYDDAGRLVLTDDGGLITKFTDDDPATPDFVGGSAFDSSGFKPTRIESPNEVVTVHEYDTLYRETARTVHYGQDVIVNPRYLAYQADRATRLANLAAEAAAAAASAKVQLDALIGQRTDALATAEQQLQGAAQSLTDTTSSAATQLQDAQSIIDAALIAKGATQDAFQTVQDAAGPAVDLVLDERAKQGAWSAAQTAHQVAQQAVTQAQAAVDALSGSDYISALGTAQMQLADAETTRDVAAGVLAAKQSDKDAAQAATNAHLASLDEAVAHAQADLDASNQSTSTDPTSTDPNSNDPGSTGSNGVLVDPSMGNNSYVPVVKSVVQAQADLAAAQAARAAAEPATILGAFDASTAASTAYTNAVSARVSLQQQTTAEIAAKTAAKLAAENAKTAANTSLQAAQARVPDFDQMAVQAASAASAATTQANKALRRGGVAEVDESVAGVIAQAALAYQEANDAAAALHILQPDAPAPLSWNEAALSATTGMPPVMAPERSEILTEYDLNGKPTKVTDPLGRVTLNEYDDLGNLTQVTEPDLTTDTSDNPTVQSFYTHHGKPWKVIDQMGNVTTTRYDALGRPVEVKGPPLTVSSSPSLQVSAVTTTEYDAAGNVIAVTDPLGRVTETLYDERNRPTHVYAPTMWDAVSGQFVRPYAVTTYDALGQPLSVTDHTGATTTNHYDRAGRKWKVEAPALLTSNVSPPATVRPTTLTYFDPGGLPLTVTNPLNQTITNTYDIHGRLKTTLDAEGIVNSFDYDAAGNRTSVKDGLNQETIFAYDGLNRLIRQTFANGDTWTHTYNAVQKESQLSPRGILTSYTYDARDRLLTVATSGTEGGIAFPPTSRSYTYDNAGKLKTVSETPSPISNLPSAALAVSYTYDALGRVTAESSHGQVHHYEYDLAGNRIRAEYSTGRIVETSYDGLNRPEAIVDGDRLTRYGYDKAGRAVILIAANGQTSSNTYDALGRLTDRVLYKTPAMDPAQRLAQFKWEHDLLGNVTKQEEIWPGEPGRAAGVRSTTMGYDANNRLTSETISHPTEGTQSTTYTYDEANNRQTKTITGGAEPGHWDYDYNAANQLTAWEHLDYPGGSVLRSASLTYDEAGNRTSQAVTQISGSYNPAYNPQPAVSGLTTYTWDAQDRLASVTLPGQLGTENSEPRTFTYAYDYRTRRISTVEQTLLSAAEKRTSITFSGGLSVAEYESTVPVNSPPSALSSTPTVEYTRGPDMGGGVGGLLYTSRSESASASVSSSRTLRYNLSNGRGDIVAQSDSYASLTWTASYEAYGKRTKETGENKDKQRGNSKDEDPTGLLNEGFRYRDIETGVWLSRDPAGFVDGPNLYAYVKQNPWSSFDPHGLSEDRIDEDGFKWSKDKHHVVPRAVARDSGWNKEAKAIFDSDMAKIDTPMGHNYSRHGKYNNEVAAEMAQFLKEKGISSVSSAKNQKELAEEFVQRILKSDNGYIKGFNKAVPKGAAAVQKWYDTAGQFMTLKSTGRAAYLGGPIVQGMVGRMAARGRLIARGVPILGTLFGAGVAYAGGARDSELAAEVVAGSTVVGGLALDASHLREVSEFQKAAINFNQDPEWYFRTDTPNETSNAIGGYFNTIKRGAQVTSEEPTSIATEDTQEDPIP